MNKKTIACAVMACALAANMAAPAMAANLDDSATPFASSYTSVEPLRVILDLDEAEIDENDSTAYTKEFHSYEDEGTDIQYYFDNQGEGKVKVELQKENSRGKFVTVDSFSVGSGQEDFDSYTADSDNKEETYRIRLTCREGYDIRGTAKAAQY